MNLARINNANSFIILLVFGLAYIFPLHLFIISYAFLGPAHYLTQIFWLKNKNYYSKEKPFIWIFWVFSAVLIFIFEPKYSGYLLAYLFFLGILAASNIAAKIKFVLSILFFLLTLPLLFFKNITDGLLISTSYLLPTIIHVFAFTFIFMLVGSLKSKSISGYISTFLLLFFASVFFFITPQPLIEGGTFDIRNIEVFNNLIIFVQENFFKVTQTPSEFDNLPVLYVQIAGFLSFIYTYHYLNWFSKVQLFNWHKQPRKVLAFIIIGYFFAISLYLYDYEIGFILLLYLSILHVLLEFPLNSIAISELGKQVKMRLKY